MSISLERNNIEIFMGKKAWCPDLILKWFRTELACVCRILVKNQNDVENLDGPQSFLLSEKEPIPKGYMLYNPVYEHFWNDKIIEIENDDCQGVGMGVGRRQWLPGGKDAAIKGQHEGRYLWHCIRVLPDLTTGVGQRDVIGYTGYLYV